MGLAGDVWGKSKVPGNCQDLGNPASTPRQACGEKGCATVGAAALLDGQGPGGGGCSTPGPPSGGTTRTDQRAGAAQRVAGLGCDGPAPDAAAVALRLGDAGPRGQCGRCKRLGRLFGPV